MFGVQRVGSQCQSQRAISQLTMTTETVLRSPASQQCGSQCLAETVSDFTMMLQLTMSTEIVLRSQRAGRDVRDSARFHN